MQTIYPKRRSIRLKWYDYALEGLYFVTIVTFRRQYLFGEVVNEDMKLNAFGKIAREEWFKTQVLRTNVELDDDEFVVMPNHVHGIIWLQGDEKKVIADDNGTECLNGTGDLQVARTRIESTSIRPKGPPTKSIGAILAGYKAAVTTRINTLRRVKGEPVWHRNYYEHIINSEREYNNIVNYIYENPANWGNKE